jgi:hypothetical protein
LVFVDKSMIGPIEDRLPRCTSPWNFERDFVVSDFTPA